MTRNNPSTSFSSFRIIGKKAQQLLQRARHSMTSKNDMKQRKMTLPPAPSCDEITVHLSVGSVIRAAFTILAIIASVWAVSILRGVLILMLLAAFAAVVMDPSITRLERLYVPRGLAILLHYVVALCLVVFLVVSFIPIIASQLQQIALFISAQVNLFLADPQIKLPLITNEVNLRLTDMVQTSLQNLSIGQFTDALERASEHLSGLTQGSWEFAKSLAGSVASFIASLIVVLVLAFFMQLEKEKILHWFRGFLAPRTRMYVDMKLEAIHMKIGMWARGEMLLMFAIFSLTLVALVILRMPYALTLALLAGFCEFIPAVGPFIAAVPAVLIGISQGGLMWGLVLVAVFYVIQWCENNLLVPLIMKRAVGLSPIAILFALMVGISFPAIIHPVLGVILSIPAATVISIFLDDLRVFRQKQN